MTRMIVFLALIISFDLNAIDGKIAIFDKQGKKTGNCEEAVVFLGFHSR